MNRWPTGAAAPGKGEAGHPAVREALPDRIVDAAIGWSVRLQHQPADGSSHRAFERWLQADDRHALAWARVGALRGDLARLPAGPVQAALRQADDHRAAARDRRRALKLLAWGGAVLGSSWLVREHLPWQRALASASTRVGEQKTLHLADGTELMLNTDSAVSTALELDRRLIVLRRGEIRVATGTDPGQAVRRPFWVHTPEGRLRAVGTRFVVRLEQGRTRVSVQEGSVELHDRSGLALTLTEGGHGGLDATGASPLAAPGFEPDAWVDGVIAGKHIRLADLLAEMARYRPGVITCDERVADWRVSGVFHVRDTDAALRFLAQVQPVRVAWHTRWWVAVGPA